MARILALLLVAGVAVASAFSHGHAPLAVTRRPQTTSSVVAKVVNLKTKVIQAKMAAKGRHRLCVFKCAARGRGPRAGAAASFTAVSTRRSNKHIYAQVVDDTQHHIIAAAASVESDLKGKGLNVETAKQVGLRAGERAKVKGVELVYFDRNGFKYHGRVAAVADGAREAGLVF